MTSADSYPHVPWLAPSPERRKPSWKVGGSFACCRNQSNCHQDSASQTRFFACWKVKPMWSLSVRLSYKAASQAHCLCQGVEGFSRIRQKWLANLMKLLSLSAIFVPVDQWRKRVLFWLGPRPTVNQKFSLKPLKSHHCGRL